MMLFRLGPAVVAIGALSGCSLYLDGACEWHDASVNEWGCYHKKTEAECWRGEERAYHADESCSDLGYEAGGEINFSSPLGINHPGANGAWGGGGGGGGGSCDTYNDQTPYFNDVQSDSFCWQAGLHRTCGQNSEADQVCGVLSGLVSNTSPCPYC